MVVITQNLLSSLGFLGTNLSLFLGFSSFLVVEGPSP